MKTWFIFASLILATSCQDMKDMKKTANEANENTKEMKGLMVEMNELTVDMKENTAAMLEQGRSKGAEEARSQKFDELMEKSGTGAKTLAACSYYQSFEYQLATYSESSKDKEFVAELRAQALKEFMMRVGDLAATVDMEKMSPITSSTNEERVLFALAATMHVNHTFQKKTTKQGSDVGPMVSFLDLITEAFVNELNGDELSSANDVVLTASHRDIAINLLKARVDILAATALKYLTTPSKYDPVMGDVFATSKTGSATSTQKTIMELLGGALQTKDFLTSLGIKKSLEPNLQGAFIGMQREAALVQENKSVSTIQIMIQKLLEN